MVPSVDVQAVGPGRYNLRKWNLAAGQCVEAAPWRAVIQIGRLGRVDELAVSCPPLVYALSRRPRRHLSFPMESE